MLKRPTIVYKAQTHVEKADDRLQGTNACGKGRRSYTRHKRLYKRPTMVYKAQTHVKTSDDRLKGANGCRKG